MTVTEHSPPLGPGIRITVRGLHDRQEELNGQRGSIVAWDDAEERWKVRMDDGMGKLLRTSNLAPIDDAVISDGGGGGQESVDAAQSFVPGMRVEVHGLQNRSELNGLIGHLVEFDDTELRWKVRMEDGTGKFLRVANLRACPIAGGGDDGASSPASAAEPAHEGDGASQSPSRRLADELATSAALAPGVRVELYALQARPELNGQTGHAVAFEEQVGRWKVRMDDGSVKSFKPCNLRPCRPPQVSRGVPAVAPASRVRVHGLKAQAHLNGQLGTAMEWDEGEGRWKVQMDDASGKMFRPGNLEVVADSGDDASAEAFREPLEALALASGDRVQICDSISRPELHGQCGIVVEPEPGEERWTIRMDDGSEHLLEVACLRLSSKSPTRTAAAGEHHRYGAGVASDSVAFGSRVRVCGHSTSARWSNRLGTVVGWDDNAGSSPANWIVRSDDGEEEHFAPSDLLVVPTAGPGACSSAHGPLTAREPSRPLVVGDRVEVCGLIGRPELNGLHGHIMDWDAEESRWKVRLDDRRGMTFRPSNVRLDGGYATGGALHAPYMNGSGSAHTSPASGENGLKADAPSEGEALAPGTCIEVCGLKSRTELNGCRGEIVAWDVDAGRWRVHLEDGGRVMLKASNLKTSEHPATSSQTQTGLLVHPIACGSRVRICGLTAQARLNGQLGTAVEFDDAEGRWKVRMDDGSGKMLKHLNLQLVDGEDTASSQSPWVVPSPRHARDRTLAPGARVEVHGLVARPDYNGLLGEIVDWDEDEGRWRVRLEVGSGAMFKPSNLRLVGPDDASLRSSPRAQIASGSPVRICGLLAQAHLNGQTGTAMEFDDTEGRWKVRLTDGSGKMLKPQNLERVDASPQQASPSSPHWSDGAAPASTTEGGLAPGARVELCGMQMRPDLNGQQGKIVAWDEYESRWRVRMDDGSGKMLKAANLQRIQHCATSFSATADAGIRKGARVRICGLESQTHLNGQVGTAVEFDVVEGRWKVRLDDGSGKLLKPDNVEVVEAWAQTTSAVHVQDRVTGEVRAESGAVSSQTQVVAVAAGGRVRICGLQMQAHLNGQFGTAVEFDDVEGRWRVLMDDGSRKMLRSSNLEAIHGEVPTNSATLNAGKSSGIARAVSSETLSTCAPAAISCGSRVRICGAQSQVHLNGQLGTVVDWCQKEGRWKVRMDDGSGKLIKRENIEAIDCNAVDPCGLPGTASGPLAADGVADLRVPAASTTSAGPPLEPSALSVGVRVEVRGLFQRPEINGTRGFIVAPDDLLGRWKVRMDDGSGKILREENLRVLPPANDFEDVDAPPPSLRDDFDIARGASFTSCLSQVSEARPVPNINSTASASHNGLALVPGARICVRGLTIRPDLNGQHGTAVEWDAVEERWKVRLDDGSGKMLRASNLELVASGSTSPWPTTPTTRASSAGGLAPGVRVCVVGLVARSEMNGMLGTCVEWVVDEERWKVRMDDGSGKMLKPNNLAVAQDGGPVLGCQGDAGDDRSIRSVSVVPGSRVRIHGLRANLELNDQLGTAVEFDAERSRWKVRMDSGDGKLMKPENLALVTL